ncbi:hypothetical protein BCR43DRAFT_495818 [Syncephalastrum racemosum]|uniref:Secreted protein n=1 Tax=Syncephalastrum racemosum TaxID=13706 RepID=A0A1X2H6H8_SYNRA|nr:hypothetical protein BCR43DRAFT_495818 [Syncephalastrum racemosum]
MKYALAMQISPLLIRFVVSISAGCTCACYRERSRERSTLHYMGYIWLDLLSSYFPTAVGVYRFLCNRRVR